MIKAYKGFNPDMTCLGFQYEEGEQYETETAKLCESGFHACLDPLDVFNYYSPISDDGEFNKFHEVELEDIDKKRINDTKVCAKKIKIGKEIGISDIIEEHIKLEKETEPSKDFSHVYNSEPYKNVVTNKPNSHVTLSGIRATSITTREESQAVTEGMFSYSVTSGECSNSVTVGNYSNAITTERYSHAITTGYRSNAITIGEASVAITQSNKSHAISNGFGSDSVTLGDYSNAITNGEHAIASVKGKGSIAVSLGAGGMAMAPLGGYITLAEWENPYEDPVLKKVVTRKVDGKKIKPNTLYTLKGGKFIECKERNFID